jgi:hypothetical protein
MHGCSLVDPGLDRSVRPGQLGCPFLTLSGCIIHLYAPASTDPPQRQKEANRRVSDNSGKLFTG